MSSSDILMVDMTFDKPTLFFEKATPQGNSVIQTLTIPPAQAAVRVGGEEHILRFKDTVHKFLPCQVVLLTTTGIQEIEGFILEIDLPEGY